MPRSASVGRGTGSTADRPRERRSGSARRVREDQNDPVLDLGGGGLRQTEGQDRELDPRSDTVGIRPPRQGRDVFERSGLRADADVVKAVLERTLASRRKGLPERVAP